MQHLILLHGAIGASSQLQQLAEKLGQQYTLHFLNFSGHGGNPLPDEPFSIDLFARELLAFMDAEQIVSASVFGYSMGGFVALYLAKRHPERFHKIVTLGTKFYWDAPTAAKEQKMTDSAVIAEKLPAFAAELEARHAPTDWKKLLNYTGNMILALGEQNAISIEDYASIATPVLLLIGDSDRMTTLEETVAVFKALPNAQMGMLPRTKHPIEQSDIDLLAYFITKFIP